MEDALEGATEMTNRPQVQGVMQLGTYSHSALIEGLATPADGSLLAVASQAGHLELWEIATASCLCRAPLPTPRNKATWTSCSEAELRINYYKFKKCKRMKNGVFFDRFIEQNGQIDE